MKLHLWLRMSHHRLLPLYLSVGFIRWSCAYSIFLGPACRHTHTQSVTKRKNNRQIRSTKSVPKQINIVVIPPPIIVQWHLIILPFRSNCSRSILCTLFGHCYSININFYDWLFIRCVYIRFSFTLKIAWWQFSFGSHDLYSCCANDDCWCCCHCF